MDKAIEYFSVFGGVKISVDIDTPIDEQIETKIFNKYKYLRNDISDISMGEPLDHKILSALALGDRRTNSAFKKVGISFDDGIDIIDKQCSRGMLRLEKSRYQLANQQFDETISERLHFTTPFAHFWFAFVSPVFKGIKNGEFDEAFKIYHNYKNQFQEVVFNQLSHEILKKSYSNTENRIINIGRYWDKDHNIDLIATTKNNKIILGTTKFSNNKMKKSELTKLKDIAKTLGIDVDIFVLFSRKGFSNELKSLKSDNLKLFTPKNFNK